MKTYISAFSLALALSIPALAADHNTATMLGLYSPEVTTKMLADASRTRMDDIRAFYAQQTDVSDAALAKAGHLSPAENEALMPHSGPVVITDEMLIQAARLAR